MRNILLTTAAVLALSVTAATAADLPVRGPAVAPAPIFVQQFSWTGFYVGLNAGAAFKGNNRCDDFRAVNPDGTTATGFPTACGVGRNDDDAKFTGGAQIGYNWQFGSLVAGVEADINYLNAGRNSAYTYTSTGPSAPFQGTYTVNNGRDHGNYFGTVRGRLGFAFDRALIYATGGLAYGANGRGASATYTGANGTATYDAGRSSDRLGYAIGAGIEYAVSNNWTVKGEYLYADLGGGRRGGYTCSSTGTTCTDQAATPTRFAGGGRGDSGIHVVRVGINYLFNSSPSRGGVVAAY